MTRDKMPKDSRPTIFSVVVRYSENVRINVTHSSNNFPIGVFVDFHFPNPLFVVNQVKVSFKCNHSDAISTIHGLKIWSAIKATYHTAFKFVR